MNHIHDSSCKEMQQMFIWFSVSLCLRVGASGVRRAALTGDF